MPEGKINNIPANQHGRSEELPAPEEVLSDKLAEQADAVTSQLRDLLPESPVAEPAVESAATAAPTSGTLEAQRTETPAEPETPVGGMGDEAFASSEPAVAEDLLLEPPAAAAGGETPQSVEAAHPATAEPSLAVEASLAASGAQIEPNSDDRLMSALAWLTMVLLQLPIVSVIQLLSTSTKDRPFQRHHAITSLLFYAAAIVYEFVAVIVYTILGALTLGCGYACLWVIFFLPHALGLYYALQAYNGKTIEMPALSNFGRQQGWL